MKKTLLLILLLLSTVAVGELQVTPRMPIANAVSHQFLTSISAGGATTLAQPAASDLSNGTTGSGGGVVLATGPTIAGPTLTGATAATGTLAVTSTTQLTGNTGIGAASDPASQLQVTSPTSVTGTCTNTASGTTVTGTGTKFLTEFHIGDTITMNAETRTIATLTSDTALTTDAWTGANTGATATRAATADYFIYPNGNFQTGGSRTSATNFGQLGFYVVTTAPGTGTTAVPTSALGVIGYTGGATNLTGAPQLNLMRAHGTEGTMSALASGDRIGAIIYRGSTAAATFGIAARIDALATEAWGVGSQGSKIQFQTVPNTTTTATTGLTIDQDQSIIIPKILGVGGGGTLAGTDINIEGTGAQGGGVNQNGIRIAHTLDSTTASRGVLISLTQKASTTVANMRQIDVEDANLGASAVITNLAGIYIADQTVGGTLNYGLHTTVTSGTGKANIFSSGSAINVLNGNTRVGSTSSPSTTLDVTGTFQTSGVNTLSNLGGTGSRAVLADATGVLSAPVSDARLKKNVESISPDDALAKIEALQGVSFNWDTSNKRVAGFGDQKEIGLIAQEVEKVVPEVVYDNKDGYKTVSYEKLNPLLIEAVKALTERVRVLESAKCH